MRRPGYLASFGSLDPAAPPMSSGPRYYHPPMPIIVRTKAPEPNLLNLLLEWLTQLK